MPLGSSLLPTVETISEKNETLNIEGEGRKGYRETTGRALGIAIYALIGRKTGIMLFVQSDAVDPKSFLRYDFKKIGTFGDVR